MKVPSVRPIGRDNANGIEWFRKQVVAAVGEVKADPRMANVLNLHVALNTLEATCGLPKTTLAELFGFMKRNDGDAV